MRERIGILILNRVTREVAVLCIPPEPSNEGSAMEGTTDREQGGRPLAEDALAAVAGDLDPDVGPIRRIELNLMATGQVIYSVVPADGSETLSGAVVP